jgi:hypothetical protein
MPSISYTQHKGKKMFSMFAPFAPYLTLEAHIEAFQTTKRGLTDKVITDPTLNKAAHDFIDAQTVFAKMLAKNLTDLTKYSVDSYATKLFPQPKV